MVGARRARVMASGARYLLRYHDINAAVSFIFLSSVWSVAHISPPSAHAVKDKRHFPVSLPTLSNQDQCCDQ